MMMDSKMKMGMGIKMEMGMRMKMMMLSVCFLCAPRQPPRGLTRRNSRRRLEQLAPLKIRARAAHLRLAVRAAAPLPCGNAMGARRPIVWHGWPGRLAPAAGLDAGLPATYGIQGQATKSAILSQIAAGMGGSRRSWRPKSLPTRSCHRWRSLGHQGGSARSRHRSHSGSSTPSGMYMLCSSRQHQKQRLHPKEPIATNRRCENSSRRGGRQLVPRGGAARGRKKARALGQGSPRRGAGWCSSHRTGKGRRARLVIPWELKWLRWF